jgi:hypothetical protein
MAISYIEATESDFKGTIIDIETWGNSIKRFDDSRAYSRVTPVIFGYINDERLEVRCAAWHSSQEKLCSEMEQIVPRLDKPLYAFNTVYERGVLYHSCGLVVDFDGELNLNPKESLRKARLALGIPNYDDPFKDDTVKCVRHWDLECRLGLGDSVSRLSLRHNRSRLLKERDILLKRGSRTPDYLKLFTVDATISNDNQAVDLVTSATPPKLKPTRISYSCIRLMTSCWL